MNALTEIKVPEKLVQSDLVAGSRPRALVPTDLEQVWRLATVIHKAGMAPKEFNSAEKISVAIMHGLEIGLPPMMALQRIAVINGRPAVWGDAVPAIAFATGQVEDFFESITGVGDHMVATCRLKRKGIKSEAERTFSVADAKTAKLWDKNIWQQYPKRMLQMRARIAFRDLFADALGGLYIAEELIGVEFDENRSAKAKDVTPRTVVRGGAKPELPPELPTQDKAELQAESKPEQTDQVDAAPSQIEDEPGNTSQTVHPPQSKPLPPLAKSRKVEDGIPANLRRSCPPADEPEAFREWIIGKLSVTKTNEDVQFVWDSFIVPNVEAEQIIPSDLRDLKEIVDFRLKELAKK